MAIDDGKQRIAADDFIGNHKESIECKSNDTGQPEAPRSRPVLACKDNIAFMRDMIDEQFMLIVTSPPYNIPGVGRRGLGRARSGRTPPDPRHKVYIRECSNQTAKIVCIGDRCSASFRDGQRNDNRGTRAPPRAIELAGEPPKASRPAFPSAGKAEAACSGLGIALRGLRKRREWPGSRRIRPARRTFSSMFAICRAARHRAAGPSPASGAGESGCGGNSAGLEPLARPARP